jgi:hypothetical protein
MPVLEQLEKDYGEEKDWCVVVQKQSGDVTGTTTSATTRAVAVAELISRHMDNKDRFLKAPIILLHSPLVDDGCTLWLIAGLLVRAEERGIVPEIRATQWQWRG